MFFIGRQVYLWHWQSELTNTVSVLFIVRQVYLWHWQSELTNTVSVFFIGRQIYLWHWQSELTNTDFVFFIVRQVYLWHWQSELTNTVSVFFTVRQAYLWHWQSELTNVDQGLFRCSWPKSGDQTMPAILNASSRVTSDWTAISIGGPAMTNDGVIRVLADISVMQRYGTFRTHTPCRILFALHWTNISLSLSIVY